MLDLLLRNGYTIEFGPFGWVCYLDGDVITDDNENPIYSNAPTEEDAARDFCVRLGLFLPSEQ